LETSEADNSFVRETARLDPVVPCCKPESGSRSISACHKGSLDFQIAC
jgi:hypothetical protein